MSKPSDHFDGRRFFNPGGPANMKSLLQVLRWKIKGGKTTWPKSIDNLVPNNFPTALTNDQVSVTFVNHASWLIQMAGMNILTDPLWSERASPFTWAGPKRVHAPGIQFKNLPKIDFVLVSHNHYDHMDRETLMALMQKYEPRFYVAKGDKKLLQSWGLKEVHEMDWWESVDLNWRTRLVYTPTQHWSARGVADRAKSLWGGFNLLSKNAEGEANGHVYFGGDAGYSPWYKEIYRRLGAPDLSLLPIGAYEPRWFMKDFHMNPADAVQAHLDLHSRQSLGMHYGCFQLTDEAIDAPEKDLRMALNERRIKPGVFTTLKPGQSRTFDYQGSSRPRKS